MRHAWLITFLVAMLSQSMARAADTDEDHRQVCPLVTKELAAAAASAVEGKGTCGGSCSGCGCKGGPGYRGPQGRCVGWKDLIKTCGPPPHSGCTPVCAIVADRCALGGRVWLKALAASLGLAITFFEARTVEGTTDSPDKTAQDSQPVPK